MYSDNAYTIIALSYTLTDLTFDDIFYLGLRATFFGESFKSHDT